MSTNSKWNCLSIMLAGMCALLLVGFSLAAADVGPFKERATSKMGNGVKSVVSAAKSAVVGKSRFGTRADGPDVNLARRPLNERAEQQNQMNQDLSTLKLSTDKIESLDPLQAYDPARMSLEKSVFDSHREFTEDAYISTQGANSTDSVRSDEQNINPRVGLRKVDYTSAFSESDARVVSSEAPDQIAQRTGGFVI
jgi:hypothetical protein